MPSTYRTVVLEPGWHFEPAKVGATDISTLGEYLRKRPFLI